MDKLEGIDNYWVLRDWLETESDKPENAVLVPILNNLIQGVNPVKLPGNDKKRGITSRVHESEFIIVFAIAYTYGINEAARRYDIDRTSIKNYIMKFADLIGSDYESILSNDDDEFSAFVKSIADDPEKALASAKCSFDLSFATPSTKSK